MVVVEILKIKNVSESANTAETILAVGHAVLACGEGALVTSVKQEPLGGSNLVPA